MRICFAVITLVFSLFLINGNEAFARDSFAPLTCAAYHDKKDEFCVASCKEGEIAICQDATEADTPKCSCEVGSKAPSLKSFLRRLKAQTAKAAGNHFIFEQDIIMQGDKDIVPKGATVISVAADCLPYNPKEPMPMYCDLKFVDVFYALPDVTPGPD